MARKRKKKKPTDAEIALAWKRFGERLVDTDLKGFDIERNPEREAEAKRLETDGKA